MDFRRAGRSLSLVAALAPAGCLAGSGLPFTSPAPTAPRPPRPPAPPPLLSGRLPPAARPLRYDVSLAVDPTKDRFTGDVVIQLEVPVATQSIVLHGRELEISRAEVLVDGQHLVASVTARQAAGSHDAPDELVVSIARPLRAGKAQLRLAYSAPLGDRLSGLYRVRAGDAFYAFTQLEPSDARRMMPCFDEPGFKVPFDVRVTTPKGNLVVANAPELERTSADDGRSSTFHFAATAPLPTYLLALAVGPLEFHDAPASPLKLRLVTVQGQSGRGGLALEAAAAQAKLLADYFDHPYPYAKLDLLAVPGFGFGAMENAGLISFREDLLLVDAGSSPEARRAMAGSVAHVLAHHWFGDLVTPAWWDDLWLSEGFATWMEAKILDAWRPSLDARLEGVLARGALLERDGLASARAARRPVAGSAEIDDAFDELGADKGAAVLGMLEGWIGPDVFRDGVRRYVKAREHGSFTSAELFAALGAASGRDVAAVASTFLDQPGVPLVRAELACDAGAPPRVKLAQSRYRPLAGLQPAWKIPICVAFEGGAAPACGLIEGATAEIALPAARCPKWIYPNADEQGYFRFALPPAQLAALGAAARGLPARSRIGLVADAWALVESGDLGADALFALLDGLKGERDRRVVEQMIAVLDGVASVLVDAGARPGFRRYVASILLPLAKELGWEAKKGEADEQRLLRPLVLSALVALAEDPGVMAEAELRAAQFLRDPGALELPVAAIALRASARRADEKRLTELQEAALRARSPGERIALMGALGSPADPTQLRRELDRTLTDPLASRDAFHVLQGAMSWPEGRPQVLAWVRAHAAELRAKMPDFLVAQLPDVVSSICEAGARDDAAKFFGEALKGVDGGDRALRQGLEVAALCIEVRGREAARVRLRFGGAKR